ncbi:hypothetical protein M9H77_31014 [Catharanthus roseus]|uniref:Uncharacterized protein n=1 Tax=Catharanthus roseus TaxID=4058 RepID=A0ACC0A069_CATRO|nr:hypothetical protein M9H77_31014 [Catharanthus roseus]
MTELLETSMDTRRNEYEDALRVTFAVFRLRGTVKDWWLRASKARALKNQPWTWIDFQEEFKTEYIPRWNYSGYWHPYHQWDSQQQLKPPQGRKWRIKRLRREKQLLAQLQPPINRPHGEQRIGNGGWQTLTPVGVHRHVLSKVKVMFLVWETRTYQGPVPWDIISTSGDVQKTRLTPSYRRSHKRKKQ